MNRLHFHGLLVIDKPAGMTSRDAVDRAARWFPRRTKIGHAGTLDPLATGVLVLAVGQATRLIEYVQAMPKVYQTRATLGATSNTDDADGEITPCADAGPVERERVETILNNQVGTIDQVPPAFSAAHVDGKRAYDLARRGAVVELTPRPVRIDRIEIARYDWPEVDLEVHCGKGTYIRSIVRDLGTSLGVGGYVSTLRRIAIGQFTVDRAISLEVDRERAVKNVLPMREAVAHLPGFVVDADQAARLRQGQSIAHDGVGEMMAVTETGELIAIGVAADGRFQPDKVLPALESH